MMIHILCKVKNNFSNTKNTQTTETSEILKDKLICDSTYFSQTRFNPFGLRLLVDTAC